MNAPFTYSNNDIRAGAPDNQLEREDAAYFLESTFGIVLDELEQCALLQRLPPGTQLITETEIDHPHIDWSGGPAAAIYLFREPVAKISEVARSGRDIVAVVPKADAAAAYVALCDYAVQAIESVGDLVMLWARDNDPRAVRGGGVAPMHAPNWSLLVNLTDGWDAEKIKEDGYVHLLGCSDASPYLTQLETN